MEAVYTYSLEPDERKIICKMLQELVQVVLAANISLWTAVDTSRRSNETNLDKLSREKKQTLARVLAENQCRHGYSQNPTLADNFSGNSHQKYKTCCCFKNQLDKFAFCLRPSYA